MCFRSRRCVPYNNGRFPFLSCGPLIVFLCLFCVIYSLFMISSCNIAPTVLANGPILRRWQSSCFGLFEWPLKTGYTVYWLELSFDIKEFKLFAFWCRLLITFANSLDPNQAEQNPNCLTHRWYS